MADHVEASAPVEHDPSSKEPNFPPSTLDLSAVEEASVAQKISQVEIEHGREGAQAIPKADEVDDTPSTNGEPSVDGASSTLPGTTFRSTETVVEPSSSVDHAVSVVTNGASVQNADAVLVPASEVASPVSKTASPVSKTASPVSKTASPVSKTATPVSKTTTPVPKTASAVSKSEPELAKSVVTKPDDSHEPTAAMPQDIAPVSVPRARLPQDRVGLLSDRIKEDPRGDMEAWTALIQEHKKHNRLNEVRNTYEAFFKVFPLDVDQWKAYADMELDNNEFHRAEDIFARNVQAHPSLKLCTAYLDYVRRRHSTSSEAGRNVVTAGFRLVLDLVGKDKDAGPLWSDYITFLRTMTGSISGNGWQDLAKKDAVRAAYQQAVCIPHSSVRSLWTEYNKFEREVDKSKFQAMMRIKSADFTQAQIARGSLDGIIQDLDGSTSARLPPALGFAGDAEFTKQVATWKRLIEWEKSDPLVFKKDQPGEWRARVLYAYKQAVVPLFFWPEMWFSAAEFCLAEGLKSEADKFLAHGTAANPESCLLAFRKAERIEASSQDNGTDEGKKQRGDTVREPYEENLNALYDLITKAKERGDRALARVQADFDKQQQQEAEALLLSKAQKDEADDDAASDTPGNPIPAAQARLTLQLQTIERGTSVQINTLKKTITFVWIALMRAMRRIQGKGMPSAAVRGARGIFADARKRGQLTSDFYTANALIEHYCFEDPVGTKIFERGWKLYPDDVEYAISYIKHLLEIRDTTNARATFEIMVSDGRLGKTPELLATAKPLFVFWHQHESMYGDLPQVIKLEQRMKDAFPEDPQLTLFSRRHSAPGFDPCAIRPLISPRAQATPKLFMSLGPPQIPSNVNSPMPRSLGSAPTAMNSPKRPFDESDSESGPPRKLFRGESPSLKGAAGRRLDAAKNRSNNLPNASAQTGGTSRKYPIPQPIYRLLLNLPPAHTARDIIRPSDAQVLQLVQASDLSRERIERVIAAYPNGMPAMPTQAATPQALQQNYGQPTAYGQSALGQHGSQYGGYLQPGSQSAPYGYGRQ